MTLRLTLLNKMRPLTDDTNRSVFITYGVILGGPSVGGGVRLLRRQTVDHRSAENFNQCHAAPGPGRTWPPPCKAENDWTKSAPWPKRCRSLKTPPLKKPALESDAVQTRRQAEDDRGRNESERAAHAKQQAFVVQSVADGLAKLSSGDLVYRLSTPFAGEYESLRGDFNSAMQETPGDDNGYLRQHSGHPRRRRRDQQGGGMTYLVALSSRRRAWRKPLRRSMKSPQQLKKLLKEPMKLALLWRRPRATRKHSGEVVCARP